MYIHIQIADVLVFVIDASKWFSTSKLGPLLQDICVRVYGTTRAFEYPSVTRFAGKLLQLKKFFNMKMALQQCVTSDKYERYNFGDDVYAADIEEGDVFDLIARILKCTGPLLLLVRLGDLKTATLSKLKGTVDYIKSLMVKTGDDSLEDKIATIFHDMVGNLESDIANCAYCIDPQFVRKSRDAPQDVMKSFWKVARQVLAHDSTDTEWLPMRATLAKELQAFRMKSGGFALEDGRERGKAAVAPHRFGFGGFGHDHRTGVPIGVGQEVFNAVAVSGFLVGVEEHRHVVVGCFDRGQHARGRAFDVAAAQSMHLVTGFGQTERVKRPLRIDRHRVEVAVQQQLGRTAFGHQVHTSLAQVLELGGETCGLQSPGRVLHDGIIHLHGLSGL